MLVRNANKAGGTDNISVISINIELYPIKIVDIAHEGATYTIIKYGHSIIVSVNSVHETPYTMEGGEVEYL